MIKLRFSKPHYNINNEEKKVVCAFDCIVYNTNTKMVINAFEAQGTAICHPNDTFDIHKGAMIAESKAKYEAYYKAKKFWSHDSIINKKKMYKALNEIIMFDMQMCYLKKSENKHIKYLCKS